MVRYGIPLFDILWIGACLLIVYLSQGAGIHYFTADEELGDIRNDGTCGENYPTRCVFD